MKTLRTLLTILFITYCGPASSGHNLDKLAGISTNPYNIRNDIMAYIDDTVQKPSRAWRSLVKIASNQQFIYYRAKTREEAQIAVGQNSIALRCLSKEYVRNEDYHIFKHIEDMMADTSARRAHIFNVSNKFFGRQGWHHPRISQEELRERCERGDYE
jgi:hypothetical protein